jgi:hypothetical protein
LCKKRQGERSGADTAPMARPPQVPAALTSAPFRASDAVGRGLLTRGQLRARCWRRLLRDVYAHDSVPDSAETRLQACRLVLRPGSVLTGLTAAWLHGAWSPRPGSPIPLHVADRPDGSRTTTSGTEGCRRALDATDVVEIHGLRVTSPECTAFGLMRRSSLVEATVVADAFLARRLVTQHGLMRYTRERRHWPHIRKVREAVELSHPLTRSPMETRLRLVLVLGGLPEPFVNAPVHDASDRYVGRPDLLYLDPVLGLEYDGRQHADTVQVDLHRENGLLVAGIPLLRYTADDVYRRPARVVQEVGAALDGRRTAAA